MSPTRDTFDFGVSLSASSLQFDLTFLNLEFPVPLAFSFVSSFFVSEERSVSLSVFFSSTLILYFNVVNFKFVFFINDERQRDKVRTKVYVCLIFLTNILRINILRIIIRSRECREKFNG